MICLTILSRDTHQSYGLLTAIITSFVADAVFCWGISVQIAINFKTNLEIYVSVDTFSRFHSLKFLWMNSQHIDRMN